MFNGSQKFPYRSIKHFLNNYDQELLFLKYTGIYPDTKKRYHSLFRSDNTPGCRFEWRSGVLYFVDNRGYNGTLYFDIVGVICNMHNVSIPKAINMIETENIPNYNINYNRRDKEMPEIRFKYAEWPIDNYFGILPGFLLNENVYLVSDYWIKENGIWYYNHIHNPKETLTIAYHFPETNSTKLYWPMKTNFRWYSNCTQDNVYGEFKIGQYLERDNSLIVITKSQKDRLILDYYCNIAAIAPQSETTLLNIETLNKCREFKRQVILYDNDETGIKYANKLSEASSFPMVFFDKGKDCFDNRNDPDYIKKIIQ